MNYDELKAAYDTASAEFREVMRISNGRSPRRFRRTSQAQKKREEIAGRKLNAAQMRLWQYQKENKTP